MARNSKHKVLVVDDHSLVRLGLARAFERSLEFDVAGQAPSIQQALDLSRSVRPAVVITDVRLSDGSGLDLVKTLRAASPRIGLVVVTMYGSDDYLFQAMEAGASAFVSKDEPAEHVVSAARQALVAPHSFTAPNLVEAMRRRKEFGQAVLLSPRESEVLNLLAEGLNVATIARRLFVSESTAKTHIARIYEKLGAVNRAQAIMAAVRAGVLGSD